MGCSSCEARRRLLLQRGLAAAKAKAKTDSEPTVELPAAQSKVPAIPSKNTLQLPDGTFVYKRK
jgi:hypothetical protein